MLSLISFGTNLSDGNAYYYMYLLENEVSFKFTNQYEINMSCANNIYLPLFFKPQIFCIYFYCCDYLILGNAKQYISGVAWHGYSGRHDTPGDFHTKHADVGKYKHPVVNTLCIN